MIDFDPAVEPRAFLRQIRVIDREIGELGLVRSSLRASLTSPGGMGGGVSGTRDPDRFAAVFARIESIERKMDERIDRLVDMKARAETLIEEIADGDQRTVLRKRYLFGRSWARITREMHYSEPQVYRIHGKAINAFRFVASGKQPEGPCKDESK